LASNVYGLDFGGTEWSSTFVSHPMKIIIRVITSQTSMPIQTMSTPCEKGAQGEIDVILAMKPIIRKSKNV
jgi:hypothetical protein